MKNELSHLSKYINWRREANIVNVSNDVMNSLLAEIRHEKVKLDNLTVRKDFMSKNGYYVRRKGNYLYVYVKEDDSYKIYTTNTYDNTKNEGDVKTVGKAAMIALHNKFKSIHGCEFKKAFGYVDEEFKRCIPKQFAYRKKDDTGKIFTNVSSVDGCSQYPSNLMGLLPDAHTAKEVKGVAFPDEEYPFAFYIKSGHCAQYGVFNTRSWMDSGFGEELFRLKQKDKWCWRPVKFDEEITILMKASKYNFNEEMQYFYARRKEDPDAKLVMNASIGMMHTRTYSKYKMAHIAAIAIARANNSILEKAKSIGKLRILHLCVDGIIYLGSDIKGVDYKELGVYHQEFVGCKFRMINNNAYIVMKGDEVIKVKHGAYDHNKDGSPITIETTKSLMDSDNWVVVNKVTEDE